MPSCSLVVQRRLRPQAWMRLVSVARCMTASSSCPTRRGGPDTARGDPATLQYGHPHPPTQTVLIPDSPAPAQQPSARSPSPKPSGIDAFPSLDSPGPGSQVRVTGAAGTGEDEEMAQFESAFPDLSGEVPYEQVSFTFLARTQYHPLIGSPGPISTRIKAVCLTVKNERR